MSEHHEAWAELRKLTVACQSTGPFHHCSWCGERFAKIREAVERLRDPELIAAERAEAEEIRRKIAAIKPRKLPPRRDRG